MCVSVSVCGGGECSFERGSYRENFPQSFSPLVSTSLEKGHDQDLSQIVS